MIATLDYKPPVTALVAGFKYNDRLVNGRVLASSLGELLQSAYTQEQLPGLLLPVPFACVSAVTTSHCNWHTGYPGIPVFP